MERKLEKLLVCIAVCCLLLSACSGGTEETKSTYPLNCKSELDFDYCISASSNGCYAVPNSVVRFIDESTGRDGMVLCSQPGCSHSDSTCSAWIGEKVDKYAEYCGKIYATVTNADRDTLFVEKDFVNNTSRTLASWHGTEHRSVDYTGLRISNNTALLYIGTTITEIVDNAPTYQLEEEYWTVDLATGEKKQLLENEKDIDKLDILSFYGNDALVLYTSMDGPLSEEEFYEQYGEDADYFLYCYSERKEELWLYDLESGEHSTVASEGFSPPMDPNFTYGAKTVYMVGNDVCIYDIVTKEQQVLLTMENVVNFWLIDNKAFVITQDGELVQFYYASLDDGVPVAFDQNNMTGLMTFSIEGETVNCFWGQTEKGRQWITKEDFYADRYDKVY